MVCLAGLTLALILCVYTSENWEQSIVVRYFISYRNIQYWGIMIHWFNARYVGQVSTEVMARAFHLGFRKGTCGDHSNHCQTFACTPKVRCMAWDDWRMNEPWAQRDPVISTHGASSFAIHHAGVEKRLITSLQFSPQPRTSKKSKPYGVKKQIQDQNNKRSKKRKKERRELISLHCPSWNPPNRSTVLIIYETFERVTPQHWWYSYCGI